MIDQLKNASDLAQGAFVAVTGLVGVFLVLVLFYVLIKLLEKVKSRKKKDADS
jgi:Na+-transporting methylmalonyl-CoA/oxaloacetate decarboxylase gamma subunit